MVEILFSTLDLVLKQGINLEEVNGTPRFRFLGDAGKLDSIIDRLCDCYVFGTPEERETISSFELNAEMSWTFLNYAERHVSTIETTADVTCFQRVLAALTFTSRWVGPYDCLTSYGYAFRAAESSGIFNPMQYMSRFASFAEVNGDPTLAGFFKKIPKNGNFPRDMQTGLAAFWV